MVRFLLELLSLGLPWAGGFVMSIDKVREQFTLLRLQFEKMHKELVNKSAAYVDLALGVCVVCAVQLDDLLCLRSGRIWSCGDDFLTASKVQTGMS